MKTSRLALQSRRVTASTVALVAAFVVPFLAHGDLVRRFGLSWSLAGYIITLIVNGSMWTLSMLYPFLLPFLATVRGIIFVAGTGAAVAY